MHYPEYRRGRLVEDLRGKHVTWTFKNRVYLVEVIDMEYRTVGAAGIVLITRHFNGEPGPDIGAGCVQVLDREPFPEQDSLSIR